MAIRELSSAMLSQLRRLTKRGKVTERISLKYYVTGQEIRCAADFSQLLY